MLWRSKVSLLVGILNAPVRNPATHFGYSADICPHGRDIAYLLTVDFRKQQTFRSKRRTS